MLRIRHFDDPNVRRAPYWGAMEKRCLALSMCAIGVAGCSSSGPNPTPNLQVPINYRNWPAFLLNVDRATTSPTDPPQVRDIYISSAGATVQKGDAFPDGTVLMMDVFAAKTGDDGKLFLDDRGRPTKGDLLKILMMGKELGWNVFVPEGLKTGDWLFFAYKSDGVTEIKDSTNACSTCHLDLSADVDWVFRYDEYFATR